MSSSLLKLVSNIILIVILIITLIIIIISCDISTSEILVSFGPYSCRISNTNIILIL